MINQILKIAFTGSTVTSHSLRCIFAFSLLILQLMAAISMILNTICVLMTPTFCFQSTLTFYLRSLLEYLNLNFTGGHLPTLPASTPVFPTSGGTLSTQFLTLKTKESSLIASWHSVAQIQFISTSCGFSHQHTTWVDPALMSTAHTLVSATINSLLNSYNNLLLALLTWLLAPSYPFSREQAEDAKWANKIITFLCIKPVQGIIAKLKPQLKKIILVTPHHPSSSFFSSPFSTTTLHSPACWLHEPYFHNNLLPALESLVQLSFLLRKLLSPLPSPFLSPANACSYFESLWFLFLLLHVSHGRLIQKSEYFP